MLIKAKIGLELDRHGRLRRNEQTDMANDSASDPDQKYKLTPVCRRSSGRGTLLKQTRLVILIKKI